MKEYEHEFADFFFLNPGPAEEIGGLWPLRGGRNIAKANYYLGPRFIECYNFHFILEGKVKFIHEETQVELQKGDVFCKFPYHIYEYYTTVADSELKMCWLAFSESHILKLINLLNLTSNKSYFRINDYYQLNHKLSIIFDFLAQGNTEEPENTLKLQSLLYDLFKFILIQKSSHVTSNTSHWLQQSKNYLENHFSDGITIQDVAKYVGVNRSYLSKCFSEEFGASPSKYLLQLKLEKAAEMLKNTSYTISEIANSLSYTSLYSFTRAFSNYYQIPPTQYRKIKQTKNL